MLPAFVSAKTIAFDFTKKTKGNALVRSILLPGWGQFFLGETDKGYIISIGAFVSAAAAYYYYYEAEKSYDRYKTIGLIADDSYSDYQSKSNNAQYALLTMALFWIYGIVDSSSGPAKEELTEDQSQRYCKKDGLKLAFDKKDMRMVFSKAF